VAVDAQGNIFVADTHNHRIEKFSGTAPTPTQRLSVGELKRRYR